MWLLVFLSCISKGTHELVEVQLDATRTALSARNAQCYADVSTRDTAIATLERRIAALEDVRKALDDRNAQLGTELDARRKEVAALVTQVPSVKPDGKPTAMEALVVSTAAEVKASIVLKSAVDYEAARKKAAFDAWVQRIQPLATEGYAEVLDIDGHTVVRIPSKVIFNEGQVTVSPRGEAVLKNLVAAVKDAPAKAIDVVAHTDDSPYHTAAFDSSWELGFAESMTIVRTLADAKLGLALSAGSAAGTQPVDTTPEGKTKNPRIELWISTDFSVPVPEPAPDKGTDKGESPPG